MVRTRGMACFSLMATPLVMGMAGVRLQSQEIRRVAEPGQQVRRARGGYICEGKLNVSPIDATYDMVSCSGPIFNAADYAALLVLGARAFPRPSGSLSSIESIRPCSSL